MKLIEIKSDGTIALPAEKLPDVATHVLKPTAEMYKATGFQPPWIGYLAKQDDEFVGTCAFKTPPVEHRVEIAYFTFQGHEGRGVATAMAVHLIKIAVAELPLVRIIAQRLPEQNASTRILEKLG